jgi:hypothetical protein
LFKHDLSLLVYPWSNRRTGELVTAAGFRAPPHQEYLYRHFLANGMVREVACGDLSLLRWTGRDVRRMQDSGDPGWREWVPPAALTVVERRTRGAGGQGSSSEQV